MVPVDYNDFSLIYTAFTSFVILIFSMKMMGRKINKVEKVV